MRKAAAVVPVILLVLAILAGLWFLLTPGETSEIHTEATTVDTREGHNDPLSSKANKGPVKTVDASGKSRKEPETTERSADTDPENKTDLPAEGLSVEISGRVVDALTGDPVPLARAVVWPDGDYASRATAKADENGVFQVVVENYEGAREDLHIRASADGYRPQPAQPVLPGQNVLKLSRHTTVVARIDGENCLPDLAWLRWEGDGDQEQIGSKFDPDTRTAAIIVEKLDEPRTCSVCAKWFGVLLESEPFKLEPGSLHEVALKVPPGGSVHVKVIGPDGRPMGGVKIEARHSILEKTTAVTNAEGEFVFGGIAAPSSFQLHVVQDETGVFSCAGRAVRIDNEGDRREILFDLSGTGIVDCNITLDGHDVLGLEVEPSDDNHDAGFRKRTVWLSHPFYVEGALNRIYGLSPGRYKVTVHNLKTKQSYTDDFEVHTPPAVSTWTRDFVTRSVKVRVVGAATTEDMTLRCLSTAGKAIAVVAPDDSGEFLITGLADTPFRIHVSGPGYASRMTEVNPATTSEVEVQVHRSGRLKLIPRDAAADELTLTGPGDSGDVLSLKPKDLSDGMVDLVPGTYSVGARWKDAAPWEPVDVLVVEGREQECRYGTDYTSTLTIRVRDRTMLMGYTVAIEQDGKPVPRRLIEGRNSDGDAFVSVMFHAEGSLKLRITGDDIQDYAKDFEIDRGATVELEIELKRR